MNGNDNANIASETLEVEALLLSRAYLYTLFHKVFGGYPSASLVDALVAPATLDVVEEYAADDATMAGLRRLLGGIAGEKGDGAVDPAALADELTGEYTRLFVGPGQPEAFPLESPYRTREATYFQENTVRVRAEYRARGLQPARLGHTPDDHVALECALMAELASRSLAAFRAGDAAELASTLRDAASFSAGHLGWIADFALACRRGTTARLYPQMAEALAAFVADDATFMAEAALWAEQMGESELVTACAAIERPAAFSAAESALGSLRAIRLLGLDENELVGAK